MRRLADWLYAPLGFVLCVIWLPWGFDKKDRMDA
jgi:hypothetical protein